MAYEPRASVPSVPSKCEVESTQRGYSSSPSNPKHTLIIPHELKAPPSKTKYRSPNSSVNDSPRARSRTPLAGKGDKENWGAKAAEGRAVKALREANAPVPKLVLPGSKPGVPVRARNMSEIDDDDRPKESDANKMDEIIKRYKREIVDQTHKMQEFRRNMVDYDTNLKHLLTTVAEDKQQKKADVLLAEKTREIEELKSQLQSGSQSSTIEIDRLSKLVREMATEITTLKAQVSQQKAELAALDAVTRERDELKRQLSEPHTFTKKDYEDLGRTIKELEDMQNSLMRENNSLKEELIKEQRRNLKVPITQETDSGFVLKSASKDVHYVQKDLSQLTHLLESLRSGGDVNLSFLLGASGREADSGLDILEEVAKLKETLSNVKLLVSDLYAEHCGSRCSLQ